MSYIIGKIYLQLYQSTQSTNNIICDAVKTNGRHHAIARKIKKYTNCNPLINQPIAKMLGIIMNKEDTLTVAEVLYLKIDPPHTMQTVIPGRKSSRVQSVTSPKNTSVDW